MMYQGKNISCTKIENNFVELQFNAGDDPINKFDRQTLEELNKAIEHIQKDASVQGLMLTSSKDSFIVGADITEFLSVFALSDESIKDWLKKVHAIFNHLEDFDFPTITAIHGYALGGGLEVALCTDFRIATPTSKIGLPEVKLGIFPGFGGSVRLPRLIGSDNAIEWIATGNEQNAKNAFLNGAIDAIVEPEKLREAALNTLKQATKGSINWKAKKQEKKSPILLGNIESTMVFEGAKGFIQAKAGPHYPAPVTSVKAIQEGAALPRDSALELERKYFVTVAKTEVAKNLVGLFLNDQFLKKKGKEYAKKALDIKKVGVLGAGIMGGGITYQCASKKIPALMKDIQDDALQQGLNEAASLFNKQLKRNKITPEKMANGLNLIQTTLSYQDMEHTNIVIEAVVEKDTIKQKALLELEQYVNDKAVITSNTSTISISKLSKALKKPERFCGMHFFNPVHRMPLVEVIRGEKTNEETIATVVEFAQNLGKKPVVVNDCPGFLVNRVLFPYFIGFYLLLNDGYDFVEIDNIMEQFGWPMGPAYLNDVVGMDTGYHALSIMAQGFPERMNIQQKTVLDVLYKKKRFGQKTDAGFYEYQLDKKGKKKKKLNPNIYEIIKPITGEKKEINKEEVIDRMMLPMLIESSFCLEENIVETPAEADMALIYGLGFPPFLGGIFKYADQIGLNEICKKAEKYQSLGKLYEPTNQMKKMATSNQKYYQ